MAVRRRQRRGPGGGRALLAAVLLCVWGRAAAERLRYAIPEELGRGSLVGPLARDLGLSADELPARKLQVASAGKKQLQYFTVSEENGNLYVNERLDREEMCGESATCSVSFEVLVHNPLNIFHVEVVIADVNDNTPRFLQDSFQLEINELTSPGARFYLGMAEDPDTGSNSLQGYELEPNGYFTVEVKESQDGSKSAELVLRRSLDRESEPSLRLLLTALDGGDPPRTGTAELWINVTDANDNPPVFAQDRYRVSLREDTPPGSIVVNISASDADAGTNAHITYGFGKMPTKVLQKFVVDAQRGTITLQEALDFEDTRMFSLTAEATDGGGLVAHSKVEVEVLDVNDNRPEITILSLSSPVPEDAPVGTVVALLNVNDLDSGENGQVSCELSGEAPLSIVASSGGSYKVVTAGALDREQASEHRVTVVARDRGRPQLLPADSGALRGVPVSHFVGIDGVRAFLQSYSHEVSLTADSRKSQLRFSAGSCCDTLPARPPPDEPAPLLGDHDPAGARPVDSASVPELQRCLSAVAAEPGPGAAAEPRPSRAPLSAAVRRLQWRGGASGCRCWPPPSGAGAAAAAAAASCPRRLLARPAPRLRYAIPEELGRGSLVGPLARDLGLSADELPARKLQVASAGKKQLQYFTVSEENGNLYVNERLDREEMCGESATCSVSFEVLVHNPLNVFHIEVAIEDVNDNTPVFSNAALELEIGEWTLSGARFPLEMARDADLGSNSLLTYQLTSDPSFSLSVKDKPGGKKQPELVLERALDREKQSSFELVLTAVDGGEPVRSGTVLVRINVTDANDNPPVFSKSVYEERVAENLPVGSSVLRVRATDVDLGANGRVSYSFSNVPDEVLSLFAIESESGEIKTVGPLDFEEKKKYVFGLEAMDGGGLTDHCEVQIDITDENDNTPEITILSLSSPVPEDALVGTVVAVLNVNDPDSGENGQVSCELSGEAPLSIVASSGGSYKVVTAGALDREQASEHRVTVVARDRGRPALWSSAELVLEVSDVNDNAPRFSVAGAAFPADFCEGTLPYSYNLCVAAPARAVPEAAWPPPPVPVLSAEELLSGEPLEKHISSRNTAEGEMPLNPDAPQLCKSIQSAQSDEVTYSCIPETVFFRCPCAGHSIMFSTNICDESSAFVLLRAGRRLRAPLLTERSERSSERRSPARCGPARSLSRCVSRRRNSLRSFPRCGDVLKGVGRAWQKRSGAKRRSCTVKPDR
uniref:protocadherin-1-like n=1 Tax=Lonchura striata TaxID=40157 RepID=UPI001293A942|nr:protocadherin-1-like [Lonchura striata domestica]